MTPTKREPDQTTYAGRFAARLRELRVAAGLTQAELAEKIGSYQRTVSGWETSLGAPSYEMLLPISKALGVSPRELLPEE